MTFPFAFLVKQSLYLLRNGNTFGGEVMLDDIGRMADFYGLGTRLLACCQISQQDHPFLSSFVSHHET